MVWDAYEGRTLSQTVGWSLRWTSWVWVAQGSWIVIPGEIGDAGRNGVALAARRGLRDDFRGNAIGTYWHLSSLSPRAAPCQATEPDPVMWPVVIFSSWPGSFQ